MFPNLSFKKPEGEHESLRCPALEFPPVFKYNKSSLNIMIGSWKL